MPQFEPVSYLYSAIGTEVNYSIPASDIANANTNITDLKKIMSDLQRQLTNVNEDINTQNSIIDNIQNNSDIQNIWNTYKIAITKPAYYVYNDNKTKEVLRHLWPDKNGKWVIAAASEDSFQNAAKKVIDWTSQINNATSQLSIDQSNIVTISNQISNIQNQLTAIENTQTQDKNTLDAAKTAQQQADDLKKQANDANKKAQDTLNAANKVQAQVNQTVDAAVKPKQQMLYIAGGVIALLAAILIFKK